VNSSQTYRIAVTKKILQIAIHFSDFSYKKHHHSIFLLTPGSRAHEKSVPLSLNSSDNLEREVKALIARHVTSKLANQSQWGSACCSASSLT